MRCSSRLILPVGRSGPSGGRSLTNWPRNTAPREFPNSPNGHAAWFAAERLPAVREIFPAMTPVPPIEAPPTVRHDWTSVDARVAMVRGLLEICGPTTAPAVASRLSITLGQAEASLEALEGEGVVLRGRFTPAEEVTSAEKKAEDGSAGASLSREVEATPAGTQSTERPIEWCHRRLLARIHRLTIDGLRKQIEPVDVPTFWRYLSRHHGLVPETRKTGANGLFRRDLAAAGDRCAGRLLGTGPVAAARFRLRTAVAR